MSRRLRVGAGRATRLIRLPLIGLAVLVLPLMLLGSAPSATAGGATFTVNSTADAIDGNAGDGLCTSVGGCTLRAAVMEANALPGSDNIVIPAGTYTLTLPGADDAAVVGDLDITDDVTIQGAGAATTIIDGNGIDRVFHVDPLLSGVNVQIHNLTVQNGSADYGGGIALWDGSLALNNVDVTSNSASFNGGGILAGGTLTFTGGTVSGNTSGEDGGGIFFADSGAIAGVVISGNSGRDGGGIYNNNVDPTVVTLSIVGSTLSGNSATNGSGGGIFNNDGTLSMSGSTVIGNSATSGGGGIKNLDTAEITNTTVSGNSAPSGGGIDNRMTLTATNVTIVDNTASSGGGIWAFDVTVVNTVLANNGTGGDCFITVAITSSHSLDSDGSCGFTGPGDLSNTDPLLGPLANYGGATDVYPLRSHSPAVDAGDNGSCPFSDQRGGIRPQDGDDDLLFECDIGAFELQPVCGGDGTVLSPSDVPIPDNDPGGVNSTVSWPESGEIIDLNLCVAIPHTWVGDLIVTLTHVDTGATATVIDRPGVPNSAYGCGGHDIFVLLDDEAGTPVENECDALLPSISSNLSPNNPLSVFDGEDISGDWRLTVSDNEPVDIGVLDRWDLLPQLLLATPSPTPTPTPTPVGQTPSPTPTPTPTATPTPTPGGPTPTPTPTSPPKPTTTPTGTPGAGNALWGDDDCNGSVAAVDALKNLQHVAAINFTQNDPCFPLGQAVGVSPAGIGQFPWGDVDCDQDVDAVDALAILRSIAALPVSQQPNCPQIGSDVLVQGT